MSGRFGILLARIWLVTQNLSAFSALVRVHYLVGLKRNFVRHSCNCNEASPVLDERSEWPLVSIITPSYNQGHFIEETILSVIGQDYPCLEHIVIDGGSTDGTLDILRKYDGRIKWISEPDEGQANAINKGFQRAGGDILGWINSDDVYTEGAIKAVVGFLADHPDVTMVHGDCALIDSKGRVKSIRKTANFGLDKLLGIVTIAQPTVFFRREVLGLIGLLDESLSFVLDWEYWVRMGIYGLKMKHVPRVQASFREHDDSKTLSYKNLFYHERFIVLNRLFSSADTPAEIGAIASRAYSGVYASCAYFYLQHGKFRESIISLTKAIRTWPVILFHYSPLFVSGALWQLAKYRLRSVRYGISDRLH